MHLDNNVDMACAKAQICHFIAGKREPFGADKIILQQIRHKMVRSCSLHISQMAWFSQIRIKRNAGPEK
jgi:hypothetical protein